MEIVLENGLKIYIEEFDDKSLDFTMIDPRETGNAYGFHSILTKKDATKLSRALDGWLSNQGLK